MAAIRSLCQSAIVLNFGKVAFQGITNDALARYALETTNGKFDLELDAFKRRGTGEARVKWIDIDRSGGSIAVGSKVTLKMKIDPYKDAPSQVRPWCLFRDDMGADVLMVMPAPGQLFEIEGSSTLQLRFENPLCPGIYSVTVGLLGPDGQITDWAENVDTLTVEPSFDSGANFDGRLGMTTLMGRWSVDSMAGSD